ncbi:MAG: hypothetical protein LQ351_005034 [Letrouitia transgressa]|nr:MAG: hypothetical protein LQ351_005034 [Letrouitia transgressa]
MDHQDTISRDIPPQVDQRFDNGAPSRSGSCSSGQCAAVPSASTADIHLDPPPAVKEPPDESDNKGSSAVNGDPGQPLPPPRRPGQGQQNATENSDYFSSSHNNSHFSLEPNPFEQSFGNPSSDASGSKPSLLPPVAALTSPAPLGGGQPSAGGYNWANSLRSGPLSPAMLGGPVGTGDYFDPSIRGSFPTPNESSLRTGLTPGGGGSMFPAPSPNSQALFQQLANGGATPGTIDFHRTAMSAAARKDTNGTNGATSQGQDQRAPVAPMEQSQHDSEAASGLYLLAQATNSTQSNNQFAVPNPPNNSLPRSQTHSHETSPNLAKRAARNANGSLGGSLSGSVRDQSEMSNEHSDSADQKPPARSRGKKSSGGKAGGTTNGRRKADDVPPKQPASKKGKTGNVNQDVDMEGMDSDDDHHDNSMQQDQYHENGKKMTDEEKRKNFLERNRFAIDPCFFSNFKTDTCVRVAALKCRQRKKQWLANLQAKVEIFSSENDTLSAQVNALREEIMQLKTILVQHKDCPISQSQGLGQYFQQQQEYQNHANPYGMAMGNGQQMMAAQRR